MEKISLIVEDQRKHRFETANYSGNYLKLPKIRLKILKGIMIGFDANSLIFLRSGIGYRLFEG
jgi:hypothetical protein